MTGTTKNAARYNTAILYAALPFATLLHTCWVTYEHHSGLATDEVYLMAAECAARLGDPVKGIDYLNTLLAAPFPEFTFSAVGVSAYQFGNFGTAARQLHLFQTAPRPMAGL